MRRSLFSGDCRPSDPQPTSEHSPRCVQGANAGTCQRELCANRDIRLLWEREPAALQHRGPSSPERRARSTRACRMRRPRRSTARSLAHYFRSGHQPGRAAFRALSRQIFLDELRRNKPLLNIGLISAQERLPMGSARPAKVINIASIDGLSVNMEPTYSYSASKAGLIHLTKRLALELAPQHIVVSAIAPGAFASNMNKLARDKGDTLAKQIPPAGSARPKTWRALRYFSPRVRAIMSWGMRWPSTAALLGRGMSWNESNLPLLLYAKPGGRMNWHLPRSTFQSRFAKSRCRIWLSS